MEYSIWQWWTGQAKTSDGITAVLPDWGLDYALWTPAQVWGQYVDMETWGPPGAMPWSAKIKYEYAGNAKTNTFGWYEDEGVGALKHEVMSGPDDYLTGWKALAPQPADGSIFGFYLGATGKTLYTEKSLNAAVSGTQQRWVKIFTDPRPDHPSEWILCWEDKNKPMEDPFTAASLKTASPVEADFNDMILRVKGATPELSTVLLLGLSLLAVPVMFRRRRS